MKIYIHIEVFSRELDSKLLLAVLAASKGHEALIINEILDDFKIKFVDPGIYHTKSLNPIGNKIQRHKKLIDNGFAVTSIDEEGGLVDYGYEIFAKRRYSAETVNQASAIFGWGDEDIKTLKKTYPLYSNKIHKTGSPRADMWKNLFNNYWETPKKLPKKPYVLISSNLALGNNVNSLENNIYKWKNKGYYDREPLLLKKHFGLAAENFLMMYEYIEAVKKLSLNSEYDVVLRPHPNENIEAWKIYLGDIVNVHVIREGSIDAWVNNAFVVVHNGCTTAIEASISNKQVISYTPFHQEYSRDFANDIGHCINTKDKLVDRVNLIFKDFKLEEKNNKKNNLITPKISDKIYLDDNELASEKIIKIWESLDNKNFSKSNSWIKFYILCKFLTLIRVIKKVIKFFFSSKSKNEKQNHKFPPLDKRDIIARVSRLKDILGIKENINCKILSERSILIKKG